MMQLIACLACGHIMPPGVTTDGAPSVGICIPCRDAAARLRGHCSRERGCLCDTSASS